MRADYQAIAQEIVAKVDAIEDKYQRVDEEKNLTERRTWNRCSALGWAFDCPRHLCLNRLCPEKETISPAQRRRFREGKLQESMLKAELRSAGVQFAADPKPLLETNYMLKGQADDMLLVGGLDVPIDYKSCSSAIFGEVEKYSESSHFTRSRFPWIRHYPAQVLAYAYLYDRPGGFLFFKDKEGGDKKPVWIGRDDSYMSQALSALTEVNERVKKDDPPPAVWVDACKYCGFMEFDFAPEARGQKVEQISDEELMALLDRRQANKEAREQFEKDDEEVKRRLKQIDRDRFLVGDYLIVNSRYQKKSYEIPEEIKAQYQKLVQVTATKITLTTEAI